MMLSSQAIRILAAVAGELKLKEAENPFEVLADVIASFIAKKTELAKNRGGSPTA